MKHVFIARTWTGILFLPPLITQDNLLVWIFNQMAKYDNEVMAYHDH